MGVAAWGGKGGGGWCHGWPGLEAYGLYEGIVADIL